MAYTAVACAEMLGTAPISLRSIAERVEARLDELLSAERERWVAFDADLAQPVDEIRRLGDALRAMA